ncbi:FG-GAP-like repeat-containing protein [Rubrivirga sp. S365]|uniref:FG-GAP-like repeat-containing protein n=1 Tax=Rubrivirga sp. S365 TaxID=3076080 RepID=UPI0028C8B6E7|nr:FG-GAP-like repeat-containing protein [Rubrivirga sp. S365]MDT7857622.1 FG-GAP-like repeat-containing protein [Rubrivirga sp. S365]
MRPVLLILAAALAAPPAAFAQSFEREAAPFPVAVGGVDVSFPFAGGFFEPRPALVDLDDDGDADLVVNVGGAGLQLYERTDDGWVWRTDRLGGVEPGNWSTFGDLDGDGDLDLLTRGNPGRVRFWRNVGEGEVPGFPRFELAADGLTTTGGPPVAVEDSSIPALGDVDGDGDPDLLAGKADIGTITYHRHDGVGPDGLPRFTFVTDTFEDIQVYEEDPSCGGPSPNIPGTIVPGTMGARSTPPAPGGAGRGGADRAGGAGRPTVRHGANAIALVSFAGGPTLDLFWGDFFAPSLFYFVNTGTVTEPDYRLEADRFPVGQPLTSGGYNAPTFGDADGDGDADLVVGVQRGLCFQGQTAVANLFYFENTGSPDRPALELRTDRLLGAVDVGTRSAPALADLDGDGDLDLVVGNEADPDDPSRARLARFENVGTDAAPAFELADDDWLALTYDYGAYGPTFGDLDADGDLDLLVGGFNGRFAFLRNTGSASAPAYEVEDERFQNVDAGQYGRGALGDLDGDGRLDLVTGASNGRLRLYRNTGTAEAPAFRTDRRGAPDSTDLAYALSIGLPEDVGQDSAPALADLDADGDLDLVVGTAGGDLLTFQNVGSPTAPRFEEVGAVPGGRRRTAPTLGDLDGDGHPDVVAGADAGGLLYWRGTDAAWTAPPAEPEE